MVKDDNKGTLNRVLAEIRLVIIPDYIILKEVPMESLVDRLILLISCTLFLVLKPITPISVIIFLTGLTISALDIVYADSLLEKVSCIFYAILCLMYPDFCIFIPLIMYDIFWHRQYPAGILNGIVIIQYCFSEKLSYNIFLFILIAFSFLLMKKTSENANLTNEYKRLRDTSQELNMLMEQKNTALIEKQDYEIHLATLKERNRIAREIHDNVGHLLSRSILMIGATIAMNQDKKLAEVLDGVKETLSNAMNSIRQSVHDLHDESIDLKEEIKRLVEEFMFCPISYEYDMTNNIDRVIKYSFITIIKEALVNIVKHSNATQVTIIVREHPGLYQLLISDNGTSTKGSLTGGIGLENMKERVTNLQGMIVISTDQGFRIFISVPKKQKRVSGKNGEGA